MGYPRLFDGGCVPGIGEGTSAWLGDMAGVLNETLPTAAAAAAVKTGASVSFADPRRPYPGREPRRRGDLPAVLSPHQGRQLSAVQERAQPSAARPQPLIARRHHAHKHHDRTHAHRDGAGAGGTTLALSGGPSGATTALSCKGASCVGKDPAAYGCDDDAKTLEIRHFEYTSVRLVTSAKCSARWAVWVNDRAACCGDIKIRTTRQVKTTYGWYTDKEQVVVASLTNNKRWTPMNRNTGDDRHNACAQMVGCTDWRA
ncbi:DUF2690 domain-containing protein [Nonomuraea sp. NPDC023979]|uniref:DUF2690 domain-containing protein n=1 Tax=Nonomuraea sp. NPDC023979 TaxID=3154796 RepID=UPI0033FCB50D